MEKRKFTIEIYNKCDWYIEIEGVEDFKDYPFLGGNVNYSFAGTKGTNKGKIARIFDIAIRDNDLVSAKDDKRFLEVCEFTHNNNSFTCNFVAALKYIKKELENEQ